MKTKRLLMQVFLILNLVGWTLLVSVLRVEAAPPQQGGTRYHTVVRGETLAGIASRYGTTFGAIAQANGIRSANLIYAGQRLAIPGAGATSSPSVSVPSASCMHHIAWGDTLAGISRRYGTSVPWLMSANGLANTLIMAGRTLRVPCGGGQIASAPPPSPQETKVASGTHHRVRAGDTLSGIALLYRTTVQGIMAANGLGNPHHIYIGQDLHIPRP